MLALHDLTWTSVCSVANVKVKTANISSKLAVSSRCKQRELLQGARGIAHCVMGSNGAIFLLGNFMLMDNHVLTI